MDEKEKREWIRVRPKKGKKINMALMTNKTEKARNLIETQIGIHRKRNVCTHSSTSIRTWDSSP